MKKVSKKYNVAKANWSYPTRIYFGVGRIKELPELCKSIGSTRPLLVTDRGLAKLAITVKVMNILVKAKLVKNDSTLFSDVNPNPDENNFAQGIKYFKQGKHDAVIAFGGGSAIDLGKMIAFMAKQTRPIWDFEDIGDYWKRANAKNIYKSIAIPTTSGTGSEVGRASVITNSKTQTKKIIFHPQVLPSVVICDPELTCTMPPAITAGTGMDAFVHSLEAYCSPFYHPLSQGIALEGMRLVVDNLYTAYKEPKHLEARAHLMSAAAMGAVAFQKGLGAVHALAHPIGSLFHTHHGTTNAVLLPYVLKYNRSAIEKKLLPAISYLGIDGGFNGFIKFITDFQKKLNIPTQLRDLGVDPKLKNKIANMALVDPSLGGNPFPLKVTDLKKILAKAI